MPHCAGSLEEPTSDTLAVPAGATPVQHGFGAAQRTIMRIPPEGNERMHTRSFIWKTSQDL